MFSNYKNWIILKPFKDFYNSLFNNNDGFSYRKGLGIFSALVALHLSEQITDDEVKQHVIASWQILCAICIGLITVQALIKFALQFFNKEKEEEKK